MTPPYEDAPTHKGRASAVRLKLLRYKLPLLYEEDKIALSQDCFKAPGAPVANT